MGMSKTETALRKAARASGETMLRLSQRSGLPYSTVNHFMHGQRGLTIASCEKLAKALGLEITIVERIQKRGAK